MAFTYNPQQIDPATGQPLSAVRFLLQDTIVTEAELQDEELFAILDATPVELPQVETVYRAAATAAGALYRRYARQVSFSSGGTSIQAQARAETWRKVALELASISAGEGFSVVYAARPATF